jgi:hypothetical protein
VEKCVNLLVVAEQPGQSGPCIKAACKAGWRVTCESSYGQLSSVLTGAQADAAVLIALDALSVGPMFNAEVEINSRCHITGTAITIHMQGGTLQEVRPSPDVRVGVRWQNPTACAAHSMCLEMVFLKDQPTALEWQAGDTGNVSLFSLEDAVAFGAGFFTPLLQDRGSSQ